MSAKVARALAPKAIEPIPVWLVHQPIAGSMGDALARDGGAKGRVRKARGHNRGGEREWLTRTPPNVLSEARKIAIRVCTRINEDVRGVGKRDLELFE